MENIFIINKLSQIKSINTELRLKIVDELMQNPATGQQLSKIFGLSKQKIHYNLKILLEAGLIQITEMGNNKEVYYQAKAKNYILDFSLNSVKNSFNGNRDMINHILEKNNIDLGRIAANLLENSLQMKPKENLLIVCGKYNLPLVRKILVEASKRQIETSLLLRDKELLNAKHNEFSLATYSWDFERFNKLLRKCDVYLYLNGESMFIPLEDVQKKKIQQKAFLKSRKIISDRNIRIAMMEGLINDKLTEENILSEINFWKSLDIDYKKLCLETKNESNKFLNSSQTKISNGKESDLEFQNQKVLCDYGSFCNLPNNCSYISIPGGEVILIPQKNSLNGKIKATSGYLFGKKIKQVEMQIKANEIIDFQAEENADLIKKAILEGGEDGRKIASINIGTNYNMKSDFIDPLYRSKVQGIVTIKWGENVSLGGDVKGLVEWQIQLENMKIESTGV